jgi:hypothetical protein
MENKSTNKDDKINHFHQFLSLNDELSLNAKQNSYSLTINNELYTNENPTLFFNDPILTGFSLLKNEDINQVSDINSKETLNVTKIGPPMNQCKTSSEYSDKNLGVFKEKILEKDIYSIDSLIRRAKKILFDTIMKYDNYVILKAYDNNLGNGINLKKILKINHSQIKNTNAAFNLKLLKTAQGIILSSNISTRHTNYPLDHNKQLIKKLLNEENEEKRKRFNDLFSLTLSECIKYLKGEMKCESLEGIDEFFEKEIKELDEDQEYKDLLKKLVKDLEKIFENKKPRKSKIKK